jgi:3-oxoadipate enol-lactonase
MPTARVGETELHYVERGQGRPLLLVHGFPLDHSMWQPQLDHFANTHRVLAPDLRGFGQSKVTAGTVTMEQFADDLAMLLDALAIRDPIVFCGLSIGGYIAWQFWKRHGKRLAGLILCDTRAAADSAETARGRLISAEQVENQGPTALANSMLGRLFAERTAQEQPDLIDATRKTMMGSSVTGMAAALRGMAARPDMTPELPRITVPTLVICGEHDVIAPVKEMREMAAAMPNAKFVEIPGAGHMAPLEQPQIVNSEVQAFLSNVK